MKASGVMALVVALVMMVVGVSAGLSGEHRPAAVALAMSFAALGLGIYLLRE